MMRDVVPGPLERASRFAIVFSCTICFISGCQTTPRYTNDRLVEMATAGADNENCRDYEFQVLVNGRQEVIRGKACPRSQ